MNQKRINKAKWLLFATLIGLVWLMLIAQKFPVNVRLGLALILSLEIITPLVLPSLIAVWLNLIMIVVGTASLLFGYIVMPTSQKLILIFAGPIEALFITGVANYLFHWSGFNVKSRAVQRYMEHYVSLVKLPGVEDATKLYQDEARSMFENPRLPLRMELRLIHVDTRQFRQFHEKYYQRILVAIADLLMAERIIGSFWELNIFLVCVNIIMAASLNLINGYTGQFSLGHAGFMAVGAYVGVILTVNFHSPFIVALLIGGFVAGILGFLIGLPTLRLKGDYLAIVEPHTAA